MNGTVRTAVVDSAGMGFRRLDRPPPQHPRPVLARRSGLPADLAAAIVAALDQRRLFVLLPFATVTGIVASLAASAPAEPWALALAGTALALLLALALLRGTGYRAVLLMVALWGGFSLLPLHGALSGTPMLQRPAYGSFEARVDEIISESADGKRIIVSEIVAAADTRPLTVRRARLFVREGPHLAPGDIIRAPIRFYPVPGPVMPGGHDTQFHSYFDGIGAYGSATAPVELVRAGDGGPARLVDALRQGISKRIDAHLAQPAAGIARAIINGDQSAVADEAREVMATAGLAHVLSISGLHLTLVAGNAFIALRLLLSLSQQLSRWLPVKSVAALGGIGAALAYFSISGGNVAALRSTIMIILVFGAVLAGRRALTMRNVAIAALLVIALDPASVLRPSFQLSFAAVVALVGAYELVRQERPRQRGPLRQLLAYTLGISLTSFVAGMATLLFSIYHFQQTSPLGLVGNLAVLPLVSFVMMPAAAIAVLLMPFGLEGPLLLAMGWSIDRMIELAALITQVSGGFDASPLLTPTALLLGLAALAWFAFFQRWQRLLGPALLPLAVLLFGLDRPPDVLIADTTRAVAVRARQGLELVTGRENSFAVDVWKEWLGEKIAAGAAARCDSIGCIVTSPAGFRVAVVEDPAGFYEDCGEVDLVVTRLRAPSTCSAPAIVDAGDLAGGGVHALYWDPLGRTFTFRPAITGHGQPWRAAR